MKKYSIVVILVFYLFPLMTRAQVDKTQLLVLGTSHLHQMAGFENQMLSNVISKLDSFNFEVIGIEKMSGELLNDIVSRRDNAFDGITKGGFGKPYLKMADTIQIVKDFTFVEAQKTSETLLRKEQLTPNERKELIYNLLAITDIPSAVLQYTYLDDTSVFKTDFDQYVAKFLEQKRTNHNEFYSLAVSLAIQERIPSLVPIDNFQDESLLLKFYPQFMQDFQNNSDILKNIGQQPIFHKLNKITQEGIQVKDLSELYTFLNSQEFMDQDYSAQWKVWLETNFPSKSDRARFSLWEMRNLQITANIMNVIARNPGKRILVIIGASHKSFLEKYLKQIEYVEVLQY
ncbi:DUF5694 domain-containing protein [Aquimarina intermedia]|uniref:TraB family protein n=1 Tax=Aquimarina intermedia TaxID=350814 RepID=A0A5S5C4Y7_9FLAO|nr:DUF5694 domain-containing protein [Aquimarina intermedia]TYP74394.1 hypothetical protein BD809_104214 [Aquimarina intermedia]